MCYMCQNDNCTIDCYYRVGNICKYGIFEAVEEPSCNPNECDCLE